MLALRQRRLDQIGRKAVNPYPLDAGVAFERTAFATVHNGIADWRRDLGLALFVILNSLFDVTEALLRLAGNLF
jgi:hypothetical protein